MTVTTTYARESYVTDGVVTAFPVNFKFVLPVDIDVYYISALGVVTVAALNIDYTVTQFINGLGQVDFLVAPLTAGRIVILRQRNLVQATSAIGKEEFSAAEVETVADNIMFLLQEVNDVVTRSLQLGIVDLDGFGAFDARGNRIKNLGDPTALQDAVTVSYALANLKGAKGDQGDPGPPGAGGDTAHVYVLRNIAGTADAITADTGFALSALSQYDIYWFLPTANITGPAQINIDGTGLIDILSPTGAALAADEIFNGRYYGLTAIGNPVTSLRIMSGF